MDCLIYPGPDFGTEIVNCDDCFDLINFVDGFTFPFYGNTYSSIFVNANGNLTFNSGSTSNSPSFSQFIDGLPRIAPYWIDLFPPGSQMEGGVFYKQLPDRFVVTWVQVPYFFGSGFPPYNTFQVVLFETGRIGFAYNNLDNNALLLFNRFALVGVAEGSNGNSCIFRYDPPENDDPQETVNGPTGFLDGKLLFFDFVDSECILTIRDCPTRGILPTVL